LGEARRAKLGQGTRRKASRVPADALEGGLVGAKEGIKHGAAACGEAAAGVRVICGSGGGIQRGGCGRHSHQRFANRQQAEGELRSRDSACRQGAHSAIGTSWCEAFQCAHAVARGRAHASARPPLARYQRPGLHRVESCYEVRALATRRQCNARAQR